MPRKQRFKPSRKPKPIDQAVQTAQAPEQQQQAPSTLPMQAASPPNSDVSNET